jgi:hypothetical protein
MRNSGLADSPFFLKNPPERESVKQSSVSDLRDKINDDTMAPTVIEGNHDVNHDAVIPRHHDTMVENVRLAVKEFGKEAATHRFTKSEKDAVAAIIFAARQQGIRTTENEITRIAVNYIIRDYDANGDQSVLAKALNSLNG